MPKSRVGKPRYSATYNPEQRRFTTSEVAADWQRIQYRGARSGSPEPALTDNWGHSMQPAGVLRQINHAIGLRPIIHGSLLIYRPVRDGWLSWPRWMTDSGRL